MMNELEVNLKENFLMNSRRSASGVIHIAFIEKIRKALKDPWLMDKNCHFYRMS